MVPPVALLAYAPDEPGRAAFWPFAAFSPEWVAVRHALARDVPVRFIDLPAAHSLAVDGEPGEPRTGPIADPLGVLAAAAGHADPETWWEDVVEHRGSGPFEAVAEAMGALRAEAGDPPAAEAAREAAMRRAIRAAAKEFATVAVVCGAW